MAIKLDPTIDKKKWKMDGKTIAFAFMGILGVFWLIPLLWMILNSFKQDSEFITSFASLNGALDYLSRLIPKEATLENYTELFFGGENINTTSDILKMFYNSFIVSITQTVVIVIITSMSAYAYERLEFKGGNGIFWTLLYISMFPSILLLLPMFRIANALDWVNNINALIWPSVAGVFNIFLIRNFMKGIPMELDEAAKIDGANSFQVYTKMILPSIAPVMIVVGLFAFNTAWNDFLWPTIVMSDPSNQTLTPGLRLLSGQYEQRWAHMIASCLISMIPPLALYLVAQKHFLRGISIGAAVKG